MPDQSLYPHRFEYKCRLYTDEEYESLEFFNRTENYLCNNYQPYYGAALEYLERPHDLKDIIWLAFWYVVFLTGPLIWIAMIADLASRIVRWLYRLCVRCYRDRRVENLDEEKKLGSKKIYLVSGAELEKIRLQKMENQVEASLLKSKKDHQIHLEKSENLGSLKDQREELETCEKVAGDGTMWGFPGNIDLERGDQDRVNDLDGVYHDASDSDFPSRSEADMRLRDGRLGPDVGDLV